MSKFKWELKPMPIIYTTVITHVDGMETTEIPKNGKCLNLKKRRSDKWRQRIWIYKEKRYGPVLYAYTDEDMNERARTNGKWIEFIEVRKKK